MKIFTASNVQIATYLLGICPFSIAFLVFLNSSVSFVITDLIRQDDKVGTAIGDLGFADELLALIACPIWGLLSDRIGVRAVCVIGYSIIAFALVLFVQAENVYPQLLLGRLFFSLGGSAASTMVTAVLPIMSEGGGNSTSTTTLNTGYRNGHAQTASIASEQTITPALFRSHSRRKPGVNQIKSRNNASTSKIAGFVGMFTGCGALIALIVFLPLPARFQKGATDPGHALQYSYYIVAGVAAILAVTCLVGLRKISQQTHSHQSSTNSDAEQSLSIRVRQDMMHAARQLSEAFMVGFKYSDIATGYIGGFVARASSVGISLFIPLLINAAFTSSGLCTPKDSDDNHIGLPDIKRRCPRAYLLASALTGVSQLVALMCAPAFGYWSARVANKNLPLMTAAACGIVGYPLLATRFDPHDENKVARSLSFLAVALIGISQIGAIVCSLGSLSSGILDRSFVIENLPSSGTVTADFASPNPEEEPLLDGTIPIQGPRLSLSHLKGSMAGIYSFYGGAGILILTKAGGALFDSTSQGAPFYMLAIFNAVLFLTCFGFSIPHQIRS